MQSEKPDDKRFVFLQNKYPAAKRFIYIGDNIKKDLSHPTNWGWLSIGIMPKPAQYSSKPIPSNTVVNTSPPFG